MTALAMPDIGPADSAAGGAAGTALAADSPALVAEGRALWPVLVGVRADVARLVRARQALTAAATAGQDRIDELLVSVDEMIGALTSVKLDALRAKEATGTWKADGSATFEAWRARSSGQGIAAASRDSRIARDLAELPATATALADGRITPEHAAVISRFGHQGHTDLRRAALKGDTEDRLLSLAQRQDAATFARSAARLGHLVDAAAVSQNHAQAHARRYLRMHRRHSGWHGEFFLDAIAGEEMRIALEANTEAPAADDERTSEQRAADALTGIASLALDSGILKTGALMRPHLSVIMNQETFAHATTRRPRRNGAGLGTAAGAGLGTAAGAGLGTAAGAGLGASAGAEAGTSSGRAPRNSAGRPRGGGRPGGGAAAEHGDPPAAASSDDALVIGDPWLADVVPELDTLSSADGSPDVVQPAPCQTADLQPAPNEAATAQPSAGPTNTQAAGEQVVEDEPVGAKPIDNHPVGKKPVDSNPVDDKPAADEPARDDPGADLLTRINAGLAAMPIPGPPTGTRYTLTTDELTELLNLAPVPTAELDDGTLIPPHVLAALLCDSFIGRIVIDAEGQPIDLGQEERTASGELRRAILARDRTCRWPGCSRPARWSEYHHLVFWSRGGRTSILNGIHLCRHHHQTGIHDRGAIIVAVPGGFDFHWPDGSFIGHTDHATRPYAHRRKG